MNATQTTGTNLAILTTDAYHNPVLTIDPGSNLRVGRIIDGLRAQRQGFRFQVEGTTLHIKGGKGDQLYHLVGTLAAKGYAIEETPAHRNRVEAAAQAKAEQQAKMAESRAQAAIPPMGFAAKRFSFRPHPLGIRVSFARQAAFVAWANGHGIEFTNLGEHEAIIGHLPTGCDWKWGESCPWCQPPVPSPAPAAPDSSWTIQELRQYCINNGISVTGLSKKAQFLAAIG